MNQQQTNFEINFKWQKQYMEAMIKIMRLYIAQMVKFRYATMSEDMRQATDMVITVKDAAIAIRLRRESCRYRDFTIRATSRGGYDTELEKLRKGWGDWYFYGWVNGDELPQYLLVNIHALRESGLLDMQRNITNNGDGTGFVAISIGELQAHNCLVACEV
jgi:hypothetical protein